MKGVFVTGTDTGVGKTLVSTILARGSKAHYWKPIQTGSERDSDFVRSFGVAVYDEAYCFERPVSPHLAAGPTEIQLETCRKRFLSMTGPLIVEGAGGVLVPLNRKVLIIDLIRALQMPALIVARTTLGTINHTLLTLEALRARGLLIAGVIFNGDSVPETESTLERYAPVLGRVPFAPRITRRWMDQIFASLSLKGTGLDGSSLTDRPS